MTHPHHPFEGSRRGGGHLLSPVEPGDPRRQSIPLSYVVISARSTDDRTHAVQVYVDISGEWCSADDSQQITWAPAQAGFNGGTLRSWTVELANQQPLTEQNQQAAWGTTVWSTPVTSGLTYQSTSKRFRMTGRCSPSAPTWAN